MVWVLTGVLLPIPIALAFSFKRRLALNRIVGIALILALFVIEVVHVFVDCGMEGCGDSGWFMLTLHFIGNLVFAGLHGALVLATLYIRSENRPKSC